MNTAALARVQENWESVVWHDPNEDRGYCYLIFERHRAGFAASACVRTDYGYESQGKAEDACHRAIMEESEAALERMVSP